MTGVGMTSVGHHGGDHRQRSSLSTILVTITATTILGPHVVRHPSCPGQALCHRQPVVGVTSVGTTSVGITIVDMTGVGIPSVGVTSVSMTRVSIISVCMTGVGTTSVGIATVLATIVANITDMRN